jgi:hypothetical protein
MDPIPHAFLVAVDSVADLLARPEVADAWHKPSALAEWSVGGLAGHLAAQAMLVVRRLEDDPSDQAPIPLDEHYRRAAWVTATVDDEVMVDIREDGDREGADGPVALVERVVAARARLAELLPTTTATQAVLIPWQGWAVSRDDFLTTRMMEIAVHSDDVAASVGITAPELPDEVLGLVLGLLTRLAVRRHGQSAILAALSRAERAPAAINAF